MTPREEFVAEIERLKLASRRTHSEYLKIDYAKAIKRKKKQLRNYDRFQQEARHGN